MKSMNIVLFIKTAVQTRTIHGRDEQFRLQYLFHCNYCGHQIEEENFSTATHQHDEKLSISLHRCGLASKIGVCLVLYISNL